MKSDYCRAVTGMEVKLPIGLNRSPRPFTAPPAVLANSILPLRPPLVMGNWSETSERSVSHRGKRDCLQTDLSPVIVMDRGADNHRVAGPVDEGHAGHEPRCIVEGQDQIGSAAAFQGSCAFRVSAIRPALTEDRKTRNWSRADHFRPTNQSGSCEGVGFDEQGRTWFHGSLHQ